jgi:hypothetical protein
MASLRGLGPLSTGIVLAAVLVAWGGNSPERGPARAPAPVVVATGPGVRGLAWTADGGSVLTAQAAGSGASPDARCPEPQPRFALSLRPAGAPGAGRTLVADPRLFEPVAAALSPDGDRVAVLGYCDEEFVGSVVIVSLAGGPAVVLPLRGSSYGTPYAPATLGWYSGSELLVLRIRSTGRPQPADLVSELLLLDPVTSRSRVVAADADLAGGSVVPGKGFLVVLAGRDPRVAFLPVGGGARTPLGPGRFAEVAPDGASVAVWDDVEAARARLRLVPLPGGGAGRTVELPGPDLSRVAWAPDASRLLAVTEVAGDDDTTYRVFVVPARGGGVTEVTLPGYDGAVLLWSPDGTRVLYTTAGDQAEVRAVPVP